MFTRPAVRPVMTTTVNTSIASFDNFDLKTRACSFGIEPFIATCFYDVAIDSFCIAKNLPIHVSLKRKSLEGTCLISRFVPFEKFSCGETYTFGHNPISINLSFASKTTCVANFIGYDTQMSIQMTPTQFICVCDGSRFIFEKKMFEILRNFLSPEISDEKRVSNLDIVYTMKYVYRRFVHFSEKDETKEDENQSEFDFFLCRLPYKRRNHPEYTKDVFQAIFFEVLFLLGVDYKFDTQKTAPKGRSYK